MKAQLKSFERLSAIIAESKLPDMPLKSASRKKSEVKPKAQKKPRSSRASNLSAQGFAPSCALALLPDTGIPLNGLWIREDGSHTDAMEGVLSPALLRYVVIGRLVGRSGATGYVVIDTDDREGVADFAKSVSRCGKYVGYMDLKENAFFATVIPGEKPSGVAVSLAEINAETAHEAFARRVLTPTPFQAAIIRGNERHRTEPTPPEPLSVEDLDAIDAGVAKLNRLMRASGDSLGQRGLYRASFSSCEIKDHNLEIQVQRSRRGAEWYVVTGRGRVASGAYSHAEIRFTVNYDALTKETSIRVCPEFSSALHWGLFSHLSIAIHRVSMWLLVDSVTEAIKATGLQIDLANSKNDTPDRTLWEEDLLAILCASEDEINRYGKGFGHLKKWIYSHWHELTGIPERPIDLSDESDDDDVKEEAINSEARAARGESVFGGKAVSETKPIAHVVKR